MIRRRFVIAVTGAVLVVALGIGLGAMAAGPGDPRVTDAERRELTSEARAYLMDNPFQGLLLLSTRVERIPDESGHPCDAILGSLGAPPGTDWHVTGYGPFGIRIGGGAITCDGDSSVDGL